MEADGTEAQARAAVAAIRRALDANAILAAWLYGSAVAGSLRPDSDLDLFVLTDRGLGPDEKRGLVDGLRPISRRAERPADWRPLEVTVVAAPNVRPWRYPPGFELQYGEWLTDDDLDEQIVSGPTESADLGVLIEMVRTTGRPLIGPPPGEMLPAVPPNDLARAIVDALPELLSDLDNDTRNVVLTLARMWSTLATGELRSKDAAADWAIARLPQAHRPLLERARDNYRHGGWGNWADDAAAARALADRMAAEVRAIGSPGRR